MTVANNLQSGVVPVYNFSAIYLSACMYVCRMITIESLDVLSSFWENTGQVYM